MPKFLLVFVLAVSALFFNTPSFAQDAEMGLTKLSKQDEAKYRQIIDAPIDQSLLNSTKIDLYIKKEVAAIMLGDQIFREKNLVEWAKIDTTAKMPLRNFYSNLGRHEDAVRIGHELLKERIPEMQFGATKARNYCYLADDYMRINDLPKANEYLLLAESEIKSMRNNNSRRSDLQAWYFRAESEYFLYKSIYLMKVGKWEESLSASKLSIERVKDTLGVINLFKDEKRIQAAKNTAAEVMRNIVNQQLQMGQLISAEWSLRDAFKLAKANGLNENHMFSFDLLSADLFNGKGQFQTSMDYIGRAQILHINQGYVKSNRRWMRSKSLELTALSGLDQWDKAFKVLQESNEGLFLSLRV
jgi:tetratricopeptide (TPR) repeat protein